MIWASQVKQISKKEKGTTLFWQWQECSDYHGMTWSYLPTSFPALLFGPEEALVPSKACLSDSGNGSHSGWIFVSKKNNTRTTRWASYWVIKPSYEQLKMAEHIWVFVGFIFHPYKRSYGHPLLSPLVPHWRSPPLYHSQPCSFTCSASCCLRAMENPVWLILEILDTVTVSNWKI